MVLNRNRVGSPERVPPVTSTAFKSTATVPPTSHTPLGPTAVPLSKRGDMDVVSFSWVFKENRQTLWSSQDKYKPPPPPCLYVDDTTIIREVHDMAILRRGDHCLIPLNVVRTMSPRLDYFISKMGSWEVFRLYHHFLMVDDVVRFSPCGL